MVAYGSNSKKLGEKRIAGEKCPVCESSDINVVVESVFAHIFWIPIFPTKKKAQPVCPSCKSIIEKRDLSQKAIDKIKVEKSNMKTPLYMFSGLAIIILLIAYLTYDSIQHEKEVANNLKNLKTSDVIVIKSVLSKKQEYYYCRVIEIRPDTIIYNVSNYSFQDGVPDESTYRRDKGKYLDFFNTKDSLYFTQKEIDSLYEVDEIYDLYRSEK